MYRQIVEEYTYGDSGMEVGVFLGHHREDSSRDFMTEGELSPTSSVFVQPARVVLRHVENGAAHRTSVYWFV
jgi:hypothetical protein